VVVGGAVPTAVPTPLAGLSAWYVSPVVNAEASIFLAVSRSHYCRVSTCMYTPKVLSSVVVVGASIPP
jgi:hypothetical protein